MIPIGTLARYEGPAPVLDGNDQLLTREAYNRHFDTAVQAAVDSAAREL